jgi:hypothetical protein
VARLKRRHKLPITDEEKGGHAAHRAAPDTAENVFSGHRVHRLKNMSPLLNLPGAHSKMERQKTRTRPAQAPCTIF